MQNLDIHRHSRPSSAYAEAAGAAIEAVDAIKEITLRSDCREATWIDAEQMTRLALKLQEIVRQFGGEQCPAS